MTKEEFLLSVKNLVLNSNTENNIKNYYEVVALVKEYAKEDSITNKEMEELLMPITDLELDDYQYDVIGDVLCGLDGRISPHMRIYLNKE